MEQIKNPKASLEFTQLLMTKFCHDITGPIGAINNGVELMEDDASMRDVAMELITDSATQAMNRLQYYRFAYGILKSDGYAEMAESKTAITDFFKALKIEVVYVGDDIAYTTYQCRILYNLCLIAASALIRGGTLTVTTHAHHDELSSLNVKAEGQTIKLDALIEDAIKGQGVPDKKSVQAHYTIMLAHEAGSLSYTLDDASLELIYKAAS